MGEAKRKREQMTEYERAMTDLGRKLADDGRLIEAGWVGLRKGWVPEDAPPEQLADMRKAFMAGAQHLFTSIMNVMDEDREPTEADLRRMDLIHRELEEFGTTLVIDLPVEGNG